MDLLTIKEIHIQVFFHWYCCTIGLFYDPYLKILWINIFPMVILQISKRPKPIVMYDRQGNKMYEEVIIMSKQPHELH